MSPLGMKFHRWGWNLNTRIFLSDHHSPYHWQWDTLCCMPGRCRHKQRHHFRYLGPKPQGLYQRAPVGSKIDKHLQEILLHWQDIFSLNAPGSSVCSAFPCFLPQMSHLTQFLVCIQLGSHASIITNCLLQVNSFEQFPEHLPCSLSHCIKDFKVLRLCRENSNASQCNQQTPNRTFSECLSICLILLIQRMTLINGCYIIQHIFG